MIENTEKIGLSSLVEFIKLLDNNMPQMAIECVIFGYHGSELKVLLSKTWTDIWSLQSGHIRQDEDIDAAAQRIVEERTALKNIYLDQFRTFGKADNRSNYELFKQILEKDGLDIADYPDLQKRFVSIGYYSLVDFEKVTPIAGLYYERSEWFAIDNLPKLALNHDQMIIKALENLRRSLDYHLVGFNLMPPVFTMKELQRLYEIILGTPLQRTSFQDKMLGLNILERLEKHYNGGAHKAPYLYKFK